MKAVVRQILHRERVACRDHPTSHEPEDSDLLSRIQAIPDDALIATIRRHRLACLLHGDRSVRELMPQLTTTIQDEARRETMAALALASLTREISALFQQARIPMLVIKGIPLALQTTGSLSGRGGLGDLDLFVDTRWLHQAVQLLEGQGFLRLPGKFPNNLNSASGRYCRWVGYELSLMRPGRLGNQWIDLHWALSNIRGSLPSFAQAWSRREQFQLANQTVDTLSHAHALEHACAHASKDQWMCLRNLIDIERLSRSIHPIDSLHLGSSAVVRWSLYATNSITTRTMINPTSDSFFPSKEQQMVLAQATRSQLLSQGIWRRAPEQPWSAKEHTKKVIWQLRSGHGLTDRIRILIGTILPPAALSDPVTGQARGAAKALAARLTRLLNHWHVSRRADPRASVE